MVSVCGLLCAMVEGRRSGSGSGSAWRWRGRRRCGRVLGRAFHGGRTLLRGEGVVGVGALGDGKFWGA